MELNVNINPEDINKLVADAVLQSTIGVQVRKIVEDKVKELAQRYDNPIQKVVEYEISNIIRQVLIEKHSDEMKKKIEEELSKQMSSEFVTKVVERGLSRY